MKYILLTIISAFLLAGCKTKTVTVEVDKVHDVYHHTTDTIRDSIKHEVFINQYIKGDTMFKDRIEKVYVDRWRIRDSITVITDSVPKPYPVVEHVAIPVTPWYNYLIIGGLCLLVLFLIFKRIIDR